jgi:hypothetical protein
MDFFSTRYDLDMYFSHKAQAEATEKIFRSEGSCVEGSAFYERIEKSEVPGREAHRIDCLSSVR